MSARHSRHVAALLLPLVSILSFEPVWSASLGDVDMDGDVDLADLLELQSCLEGPGRHVGAGCAPFDFDGDGDVDLADYVRFQSVWTGSKQLSSDWDLYMLRLVNRARVDPLGEAARIGSDVSDASEPVPPLAYDAQSSQAASSHTRWMHENLGHISSGRSPDSHVHYETLDGSPDGVPALDTPSYTGATPSDRITATGFDWDRAGENILTFYSTRSIPVDPGRTEANHRAWLESDGHRANLLRSGFTAFGYRSESRPFLPPLGGLDAPFDNIHFATQNFARPQFAPMTYVLGLLLLGTSAARPQDRPARPLPIPRL